MEPIRRFFSRKEDDPLKTVVNKWEMFLRSFSDSNLIVGEDWNPWREWCRSWETYEQSHSRKPKSDKKKVTLWRELYCAAKRTEDMLNEAMAMRQHFKMEKSQLENLRKENLLLETRCKTLQEQLDYEQRKNVLYNQHHEQELIKEVTLRHSSQKENQMLRDTLQEVTKQRDGLEFQISCFKAQLENKSQRQAEELEYQIWDLKSQLEKKSQRQAEELEYQISDLKEQLEQAKQVSLTYNNNRLYQRFIIVNDRSFNKYLEDGERWHDKARRAGVGCPSRYKIWKRLECHEDPHLTLNNASYWQLVVQLSRYEDLVTRELR